MFTGLVQIIGTIKAVKKSPKGIDYSIQAADVAFLSDIKLGDSVSVDGVCQTVVECKSNTIRFEAVESTISKTTLASLKVGQVVNLEKALKMGDAVGGHLVSGHVGSTGHIRSISRRGDGYVFLIAATKEARDLMFNEGSIAIDGISLTVSKIVASSLFEVNVIPHTYTHTTLKHKRPNDRVNIEIDLISKNIHHMLNNKRGTYALFS